MRVVGLDLSLTGSGVAIVNSGYTPPGLAPLEPIIRVEEHGTKPTSDDLAARGARLRAVATPVIRAARGSDLVVLEDLYMGKGTGAQLDRAGLFWLVVNTLTAEGYPVTAVSPSGLKMYALGKGSGAGTDKDYVLAAVVRRYPHVPVQSNNTADALVLAAMGARRLGCPIDPDLPETHLRALRAVKWPASINRQEQ